MKRTPEHIDDSKPAERCVRAGCRNPADHGGVYCGTHKEVVSDIGHVADVESGARPASALDTQIGGSHYKQFVIQPIEFKVANGMGAAEGMVLDYICRWHLKGGLEDLRKAVHTLELLIELTEKYGTPSTPSK